MPYTEARKTPLERQARRQASERTASSKTRAREAREREVERSRAREDLVRGRVAERSTANETRERTGEKAIVQVRLRGEESIDLEYSMRVLALGSTSEALREGLRLLHREASEVEAAENIQTFYSGELAPLPDGVAPADDADLAAADNSEW